MNEAHIKGRWHPCYVIDISVVEPQDVLDFEPIKQLLHSVHFC
jgi:hypothetical protein